MQHTQGQHQINLRCGPQGFGYVPEFRAETNLSQHQIRYRVRYRVTLYAYRITKHVT
jgi:hypothetical protein